MIYVTGDTHGMNDFAKLRYFARCNPELTKDDYVIVAGDCGIAFLPERYEEYLAQYRDLPFTVLFVDGNHENFDMLDKMQTEIWQGGRVHKLAPDVIHLMRGQIFTLENKKIFTFGGGTSVDRASRIEGYSWWSQEIPDRSEVAEAKRNLAKIGGEVDYVITHSCDRDALSSRVVQRAHYRKTKTYEDNLILTDLSQHFSYKRWYFGHYHQDGDVSGSKTALYFEILPLGCSFTDYKVGQANGVYNW